MKTAKFLFIIVLVALSSVVYAQILEPGDIDIFIKGFSILNKDLDGEGIEEYQERVEDVFNMNSDGTELLTDDFDERRALWQDFLDIEVPKKIEATFGEMGWETSGHKKLFTIMYGLTMIAVAEYADSETANSLLDFFDKRDIRLIKDNIDELIAVLDY